MVKPYNVAQMPDQTGKVVIVTGATNGLGYEVGKAFAMKGATLILAVRNVALGEERVAEFRQLNPRAVFNVMYVDMGDLQSVREFATAFSAKYDRLDILINNAGVMAVPYGKTKDGFETHLGVNYLGHFALTGLLLARIKQTPNSRILTLGSGAEMLGNLHTLLADMQQEKGYQRWISYGHSKLAQVVFAYELNRRLREAGYSATAMSANPGVAHSNLRMNGMTREPNLIHRFTHTFFEMLARSQEMGATPLLYATTSPEAEGGAYYGAQYFQVWGYPAKVRSSRQSYDEALARQLWEVSERLTGVSYAF